MIYSSVGTVQVPGLPPGVFENCVLYAVNYTELSVFGVISYSIGLDTIVDKGANVTPSQGSAGTSTTKTSVKKTLSSVGFHDSSAIEYVP